MEGATSLSDPSFEDDETQELKSESASAISYMLEINPWLFEESKLGLGDGQSSSCDKEPGGGVLLRSDLLWSVAKSFRSYPGKVGEGKGLSILGKGLPVPSKSETDRDEGPVGDGVAVVTVDAEPIATSKSFSWFTSFVGVIGIKPLQYNLLEL